MLLIWVFLAVVVLEHVPFCEIENYFHLEEAAGRGRGSVPSLAAAPVLHTMPSWLIIGTRGQGLWHLQGRGSHVPG